MFKKVLCKLKNNKGLTLLEVIVASAVSCIILGAAIGVILPTTKNITYNKDIANAKDMSTKIIYELKDRIKYAKAITIVDNPDIFTNEYKNYYNFYEAITTPGSPKTLGFSVPVKPGETAPKTGFLADDSKYKNIQIKTTFSIDATTNQLFVTINVYKTSTGSPFLYKTTAKIEALNCNAGPILADSSKKECNAISCVI